MQENIALTPDELATEQERWLDARIKAIIRHINVQLTQHPPENHYNIEVSCDGDRWIPGNHSYVVVERKVTETFEKAGWTTKVEVKWYGGTKLTCSLTKPKVANQHPYR